MSKTGSYLTRRKLIKEAMLAGLGGAMIPLTGFAGTNQQVKKKSGLGL